MVFKISWKAFTDWEQDWNPVLPSGNRDHKDNRFGQKFINDHRNKGFIHTDPGVFYEENYIDVRRLILSKYVEKEND